MRLPNYRPCKLLALLEETARMSYAQTLGLTACGRCPDFATDNNVAAKNSATGSMVKGWDRCL
jgi:hypothetical protein